MRRHLKWFVLASIIILLALVAAFAPTFNAPITYQVSPLTLLSPQLDPRSYLPIIARDYEYQTPTITPTDRPTPEPPTDTPTPTPTATLRPTP